MVHRTVKITKDKNQNQNLAQQNCKFRLKKVCWRLSVLKVITQKQTFLEINHLLSWTSRRLTGRCGWGCVSTSAAVVKFIRTNYLFFKRYTHHIHSIVNSNMSIFNPGSLKAQALQFPFLSSTRIQNNTEIPWIDRFQARSGTPNIFLRKTYNWLLLSSAVNITQIFRVMNYVPPCNTHTLDYSNI
jgi:hypothetical protein